MVIVWVSIENFSEIHENLTALMCIQPKVPRTNKRDKLLQREN